MSISVRDKLSVQQGFVAWKKTAMLAVLHVASVLLCSILTGCGSGSHDPSVPLFGGSFSGFVSSGGMSLSNASIKIYAAGKGENAMSSPLFTQQLHSTADGRFTVPDTYSCPDANAQMYIVATGGLSDAQAGVITASTLMASLGSCSDMKKMSAVEVNELTTVAFIAALQPYMQSVGSIGAISENTRGLQDAFISARDVAKALKDANQNPSLPQSQIPPIQRLATLANVLSACNQTSGGSAGDGSPCGNLFASTRAPQSSTVPHDTAAAMLAITKNPMSNVNLIYSLLPAASPFQPLLSTAPEDWRIVFGPEPHPPVFSPTPGSYNGIQSISLTDSEPSVRIYYSIDGSWKEYSAPFTLSSSKVLHAFAIGNGVSPMTSATYTIAAPLLSVSALSTITVGQTGTGMISLSVAAPHGGALVSVSSSAPSIAAVSPSTITMAEGQNSGSFTYTGSADGVATFTASAPGFTSGSTQVTLLPAVGVTLTPSPILLKSLQMQQFIPNVTGTSNSTVLWSVAPALGTISAAGLYTAPASIATVQTLKVIATSIANPSASGTAIITLLPAVPSGLAGFWPLDEGSGTTAFDRSGNGLNGTWQGAQSGDTGYYSGNTGSYSGSFDGKTTTISLGGVYPDVTGPLSMTAWVQQASLAATGTNPLIFGSGAASLYINPASANVWVHLNAGGKDHYLGTNTGLSQWHQVTMTYDNSTLSFFLDGVLSSAESASGTVGPLSNLAIGGGGTWSDYPGFINGVQLYRRALSPIEVLTAYQIGRGVASAPGSVSAVAGDNGALVSFNVPSSNGGTAITSYIITANPGGVTTNVLQATPTIVTGLNNGTAYTFTVTAMNSVGASIPSAPSNAVTPSVAVVTVNWNEVHQQIDGFGASDAFTYPPLTPAQADLFFSPVLGVGLSLLRTAIPNDGSCTSVSTACAGSVSDMQLATIRGARIFSTPWSPPASMTSNGSTDCTVGPSPSSLLPSSYVTYAAYLSNFIQSVKNASIPLYAISIQNEPDFCASYGGAIWSDVNLHDFVKSNLGPTLASKDQSEIKIMLPESGSWVNFTGLTAKTMADPAAAAYVGILAYHGYDNPSAISNPYAKSGKSFWETEVSALPRITPTLTTCQGCWDPSMQDGLMWAQVIHRSLATAGVNAWNYWWLINNGSDDNEGLVRNGVVSKRLYVMGNYSKFVRPGWMRVGTTENPTPGVYVTAYKDPTNKKFAIIAINTMPGSIPITFKLDNTSITGPVIPWVTANNDNLAQRASIAPAGGSFNVNLNAASVTTFTGNAGN